MNEVPVCFLSENRWLTGIIHRPEQPISDQGILMVVGGPQTRVGSHRQFVLLARYLAKNGYVVMRFDYHGMGDSDGELSSFLDTAGDIDSALAEFQHQCPEVSRFSLWGLCDAASAILLYCHQTDSHHVDQMIMLNPWVTTAELKAKVMLQHYYWSKLTDKKFWKKLIRCDLNIHESWVGLMSNVNNMIQGHNVSQSAQTITPNADNYVRLMKQGLQGFTGEVRIILSGNDLVAAEFESLVKSDSQWKGLIDRPTVVTTKIEAANHTFASADWRRQVEGITLEALQQPN